MAALAVAAAVLFAGGALVGVALLDGEGSWADQRILAWVETHRTPAVLSAAQAVTKLADLIGFGLIVLVLVVLAWWRTRLVDLSLMIVVMVTGGQALGTAIKQIVDRPRPQDGLAYTSSSAFPSGHSSRAMVCALVAAWLLAWGGQHLMRRLAAAAAILLAAAVGASRVILQVHWATDVLGGLVLGALWFGAVLVILRPAASEPG